MFIWGSSLVVAKFALSTLHPLTLMFLRLCVASCVFAGIFGLQSLRGGKSHTRRRPTTRSDLLLILIMALCEPCLYFVFEGYALRYTSASQAGVITALLPVMVAVGAMLFLQERQNRRIWAGLAVALGGVIWLSLTGRVEESAPRPIFGNFLEFCAICSTTGYVLLVKRLSARHAPLFLTAAQSFIGVVFFLLVVLFAEAPLPETFQPEIIASVIYLGAVVSLGAYALYNFGISSVTATQAAVFVYLIPAFTVLLGWLFLGEQLAPQQWFGAALTLVGVCLCQRGAPSDIKTRPGA